jgi:tetratricopeptide (TPR) repeat protein
MDEQSVTLVPAATDSAETFASLGIEHFYAGDAQLALSELRAALNIDERNPIILIHLGLLHATMLGDAKKALRFFKRTFELHPSFLTELYKDSSNADVVRLMTKIDSFLDETASHPKQEFGQGYIDQMVSILATHHAAAKPKPVKPKTAKTKAAKPKAVKPKAEAKPKKPSTRKTKAE